MPLVISRGSCPPIDGFWSYLKKKSFEGIFGQGALMSYTIL
jgi:hypothetical protein